MDKIKKVVHQRNRFSERRGLLKGFVRKTFRDVESYEKEYASTHWKTAYLATNCLLRRNMFAFALLLLLAFSFAARSQYYGNYYCKPGRDVAVHLFEWKWTDVQKECSWLAEKNYCAVQVSPPNEHRIITNPSYPWYQRYQEVSYSMNSRSGSEQQFKNMVAACNNLGVYIYVDAVFNHMTGGGWGTGSSGTSFNADTLQFPGVPFGPNDFHNSNECKSYDGEIHNYNDQSEVRNCRLSGLVDLRGESEYVRQKIADFLNKLISWGVAGFRVDAAKHMYPNDIYTIVNRLTNLNTAWFPSGTKPYIYQEVIDLGGEAVKATEYTYIGRVTEFKHGQNLGNVFRKNNGQKLSYLKNYGQPWGQLSPTDALVFIDNHDNQRGHGAGGFGTILTFWDAKLYKMATEFELAWQYGHVRLMSSYLWPRNIVNGKDTNDWVGPPSNGGGSTKDVVCFGDWICEHRWRQMYNMVRFHNKALGYANSHWWDNGAQAIAFGRSGRGFIIINNESFGVNVRLTTGMPDGSYCDVITCDNNKPPCGNSSGACRPEIVVSGGQASFNVATGDDPVIAIHV